MTRRRERKPAGTETRRRAAHAMRATTRERPSAAKLVRGSARRPGSAGPTPAGPRGVPPIERPHPHGLFGYVVEDEQRTSNCLRLLRWVISGAVVLAGVVALVLWLLLQLTVVEAMVGGLSSAAAAGAGWRLWLRRHTRRREVA